jgi:hypothetical protein
LNHFTVPVSSTAMPEDDPINVVVPKFDRRDVVDLAVLLSMLDDLGDMWSLVSGTDADFKGFARLHRVDAALKEHAPMEEGVAGPIRKFDEAKSLLRTEPFYDATDRRTGGWFEPGLAEPGSGAESTGLRQVVVIVEFATPRMTKILISQLCFLGAWWRISSVA